MRTRINDIPGAKKLVEDLAANFAHSHRHFLGNPPDLEKSCEVSLVKHADGRVAIEVGVAPRQTAGMLEASLKPELASLQHLNGNHSGRGAAIFMPIDLSQGTLPLADASGNLRRLSAEEKICLGL